MYGSRASHYPDFVRPVAVIAAQQLKFTVARRFSGAREAPGLESRQSLADSMFAATRFQVPVPRSSAWDNRETGKVKKD
jgi:hypothetical protein